MDYSIHVYLTKLGISLATAAVEPIVWMVIVFALIAGWRRAGGLAAMAGAIALFCINEAIAYSNHGVFGGDGSSYMFLAGTAGAVIWLCAFLVGHSARVMYPEGG